MIKKIYDTWYLSVSPDILNIPNIPDIPEFPLILKLLSRCPTMQNLEVLASEMAEILQFQEISKKICDVKDPYRPNSDRQSDLYYPLVTDKKIVSKFT